jgi:hypothetical protein
LRGPKPRRKACAIDAADRALPDADVRVSAALRILAQESNLSANLAGGARVVAWRLRQTSDNHPRAAPDMAHGLQ